MNDLDGFYKYAGTTTSWNDLGILVHRRSSSRFLPWSDVAGAQIRRGDWSSFVQVLRRGAVPTADPSSDELALPVRSAADANRLQSTFMWRGSGRSVSFEPKPGSAAQSS